MDTHRSAEKLREIGRPFAKGYDPRRNEGGRPPLSEEVKDAFRAGVPEAVERLRGFMVGKDPRLALEATRYWLDRALGKPTEKHALVEDEGLGYTITVMPLEVSDTAPVALPESEGVESVSTHKSE